MAFGTRSTLSAQDAAAIAAGRGIGAARDWIRAQFEGYSRDCGGCLEVKTDAFVQPAAERVAESTTIANVYAVLKGTEAGPNPRTVLVTGHYDSRNSDNFDVTHDAPGANDDASGTAVSLECARVLSHLRFPGTVIFLTVAGEEQGLYGSGHFAKAARAGGWNLEAVLNDDIVGGNRGEGHGRSGWGGWRRRGGHRCGSSCRGRDCGPWWYVEGPDSGLRAAPDDHGPRYQEPDQQRGPQPDAKPLQILSHGG